MHAVCAKGLGYPIPVRLNLALAGGFLSGTVAVILLVPLVVPQQPAWGLSLLLFPAVTPTLWALVHEAIHCSLHPKRRWNDLVGRALAISFGAPLHPLRFGHLTHHRLYGVPEDRLAQRRPLPRVLAVPFHYFRVLGGVYLAEVASVLIAFLPRRLLARIAQMTLRRHPAGALDNRQRVERHLLSRDGLARMRVDSLLIIALYGTGFLLYGRHAWMLAAALGARAIIVSFMDNIYHYKLPGTPRRTLNLTLPRWLSGVLLHANLHAVHHRQPGVPWSGLPAAERLYPGMAEMGFGKMAAEQLFRAVA